MGRLASRAAELSPLDRNDHLFGGRLVGPTTIVLTEWNQLHDLAKHGWLYRGQRAAEWPLQTSLERCCDRESIAPDRRSYIETEFIREFRRSYHQYAQHLPNPEAPLEWVSIMQHHGAPTRLLDFTYSIYVAAYFALEDADLDSAIWAVNGPWALKESYRLFEGNKDQRDIDHTLRLLNEGDEEVLRRLFFERPFVPLVAPVNPFRLNERLRVQKGVFLAPGTVELPFMDNLGLLDGWDRPEHFLKIVLPRDMRHEGIRALSAMNVTSTSLFPGLDGFARSLGVYHISFNPVAWQ
jgi:hypothetical protein